MSSVCGPALLKPADLFEDTTMSLSHEVAEFIGMSGVDHEAAKALRDCSADVQRAVIERGDLIGARNPSSLLLARIRNARSALPVFDCAGSEVNARAADDRGEGEGALRTHGADQRMGNMMREGLPDLQRISDAMAKKVGPTSGSSGTAPREGALSQLHQGQHLGESGGARQNVEDFIRSNDIDEHAANVLQGCPLHIQDTVMGRGNLRSARNPSAALLTRIRDAQSDSLVGGVQQNIEDFIRSNDIDEHAANVLHGCPSHIQEAAIGRGDLRSARNPSAALLTRIRDAQSDALVGDAQACNVQGQPPRAGESSLVYEIEDFLDLCNVQHWAADQLRSCDPDVQRAVLGRGAIAPGDPSLGLLTCIRDVMVEMLDASRASSGALDTRADVCDMRDIIEKFIRAHAVDQRSADALRDCPPDMQQLVMDRGIATARNPSSALLARIRDARATTPGLGAPRTTDTKAAAREGSRRDRGGDRYAPY